MADDYETRLNALLDRLIAIMAGAMPGLQPEADEAKLLGEIDASAEHGMDALIERIVGRLKGKHVKTHQAADDE